MSWRDIRPIALGIVWRDDELLVFEGYDPAEDETFYRLLGGGIEFGELGIDAVAREFDEELGVTLRNVEYVETYENVFTFEGDAGHELVRVYEGEIAEEWPYDRDELKGYEAETDEAFPVVWRDPSSFVDGDPFYPEVLLSDLVAVDRAKNRSGR